MNLTDKDILELNELCGAVVDESLTKAQEARLTQWLASSEEARRFYVRALGMSASLYQYASELQTERPDAAAAPAPKPRRWWFLGALAMAACLAIVVWIERPRLKHDTGPTVAPTLVAANQGEFVARLTGSKECQWTDGGASIEAAGRFRAGQRVELAKGFAEITFDSGAQVVLEGPASLDVNSAWSATLNRGSLRASLPPEAMGFSISNPTVEVVDLGTEFTMFADASGATTSVLVLKGEVEAAPKTQPDQQPIVLRAKEARVFATSGVSSVHNSDVTFGQLTQVELDHFVSPSGYAHWAFDETAGDVFKVDSSGLPEDASDTQLQKPPTAGLAAAHVPGRFDEALHFDGHTYAKAAFPGLSENTPHTVVFWVKVPKDATNAYAMLAWGVNSKEMGSHPIHIGWNRTPGEGTLGALRTDYGGGFAIGATPLRDGNWHHVAVVFMPRDDPKSPMEVKQYVDGRFEGEGRPSPPGSHIFMYPTQASPDIANGAFWLGCRLGINGVRADRFVGDMDELYIADRALEPQEIVRLMSGNHFHF